MHEDAERYTETKESAYAEDFETSDSLTILLKQSCNTRNPDASSITKDSTVFFS